MDIIKIINSILMIVFLISYSYQFAYLVVPLIQRTPVHSKTKSHRYAVLISARNEQAVIGNLINSIWAQSYSRELLTVFVVADNCTDETARVAREAGAVVYERFNKQLVGKGYALDELLAHIKADYARDAFDGFFVFDADNVLDEHYIEEMNKTFSDGYTVVTGYRNSKNYGDNWISAGYALWFLRDSKYLNNARLLLGTSCVVSGTGFLFSRDVLERCGGWPYHLLTEDTQFTVDQVLHGEIIGYCPTAILYDEQPVKFKQSWHQRMRWSKGYLQVLRHYGWPLIKGIFRGSFSCFDMIMSIMPAYALNVVAIVVNVVGGIIAIINGASVFQPVLALLQLLAGMCGTVFILGVITTITEWKHIHTTAFRKIIFTVTFPLFMLTYAPIAFVAIFKKVEWKPITHTQAKGLEEIRGKDKAA